MAMAPACLYWCQGDSASQVYLTPFLMRTFQFNMGVNQRRSSQGGENATLFRRFCCDGSTHCRPDARRIESILCQTPG